ncbi:MAG: hypothetical protein Q9201_006692 [Fulgogasparrea decipioides]
MGPGAGGRGGMQFGAQQGMMLPSMQAGRAGSFPGVQGQQGGRGGAQQMQPNTFALPGQMPFGAMPQGPGGFPSMAYPQAQAIAQVQAQLGRGGQGGRGQMPAMQGMPQQMMGLQGAVRGRDRGPQFAGQPARSGAAANIGMPANVGAFAQQGRGAMVGSMAQSAPVPGGSPGAGAEYIASAPAHQQKQLLGEALYPKIQNMEPQLAGKITGMLLEMDNSELIQLYVYYLSLSVSQEVFADKCRIEDTDKLREKVNEALAVFNDYVKTQGNESSGDQEAVSDERPAEADNEGPKA